MYQLNVYPIKSITNTINLLTITSGVVFFQNNKVLVVREGNEGLFSFPGGTCKRGESFEHTAIREVREELSINISLKGDPFIYEFERYIGNDVELLLLFHFLVGKVNGPLKLASNAKELKWKAINEDYSDCFPNVLPAVEFFNSQFGTHSTYEIK